MRAYLLVVVLCGLFFPALLAAADRPANVVLIVSDDQGYHDLGCFGAKDVRTPNLDRLAKEGTRLTSFYVAWNACTPSRASFLTGRYPQRNGTYDMIRNDRVDDGHLYSAEEYAVSPEHILGTDVREIFLSNVLTQAGYRCGCYGKWDGGQLKRFLPLQRGFHDFYGFCNTGIDYFTHERYGVPSMFADNDPTTQDQGTYATTLFRDHALNFIDQNHEQPFFLYVPFNAPHGASNLDPEIRGTVQASPEYMQLYPPGDDKRAERRRGYVAAVTEMDAAIGAILDRLEQYQIADDTLVIFFSDNGGSGLANNAPLQGRKSTMWEGGNRVPCLIRWPGHVPAGQVSDAFLTSLEVFPTACAAAGAKLPEGVSYDGFDMLPVLSGKIASPRKEMFWERRGEVAVRVGDWKWLDSKRGKGLYYLPDDIGEKHDLSQKHPEKVQQLQDRLAKWQAEMQAAEPRGPFRDY
ncbi:sulfatase-like hydrolase/transferase [Blastopirellula marina]|uniref:N-acetylgalactosamine-6-sulfatase n=1 Tax=Blastopirellula marina TaxID=124 RepID=A0A2S8F9G6_9BACT|nr:sulfatase-like hydrolase/transferase [Blastopirellula marina]PQO28782.1 N-acetylgalactosamine-6-sulfatase [Blastopirellula marina]PTL42055.1 N-acetylgalactosamine-6-sulfatase [Blastopirellula marina]